MSELEHQSAIEGRTPVVYAREMWSWLHTLDVPFAFLLALPFLVAAAAFLGEWVRWHSRHKNGVAT